MRLDRWEQRAIIFRGRQFLPHSVFQGLVALLAMCAASAFAQSNNPVVKVAAPVRLQAASETQPHDTASDPHGPQAGASTLSQLSPKTGIPALLNSLLPDADRTTLVEMLRGAKSPDPLPRPEARSVPSSATGAVRAASARQPLRLKLPFLVWPRSHDTARTDASETDAAPRRTEPVTSRITDAKPVPVAPVEVRLQSSELPTPDPEQAAAADQPVDSEETGRNTVRFRGQAVRIANPSHTLAPAPEDRAAEDPEPGKLKTRFARRGVDRIQPMESSEQRRQASHTLVRQTSNGDERSELISFLRNATRSEEQWAAVASVTHVRPIALAQAPDGDTEQTALTNAEEPGTTADDPDTVHIAEADEAGEESPAADLNADGLKSIREVTLDIRPEEGELPDDLAAAKFLDAGEVRHPPGTNRPWPLYEFWWEAPAVCHRPLYFEEVNLERYGYSHGMIQPLLSGAHFFGTVPALPYLMTAEPHRECVYTLGHYRPGSYAPYRIHHPPVSLRGAAVEAAVVTGLIFAMP